MTDLVLRFPKITRNVRGVGNKQLIEPKQWNRFHLDIAEVKGQVITKNWCSMREYNFYKHLERDELYTELLSEMMSSLEDISKEKIRMYEHVIHKIDNNEPYFKIASDISEVEEDFIKLDHYIKKSKDYMKANVDEIEKGETYTNSDSKMIESFKNSVSYLENYEQSVKSMLTEIQFYSKKETINNQYHLSEIMKFFAVITVTLTIPTLIFSLYGMNVESDIFKKVQLGSVIVLLVVPLTAFVLIYAYFKDWLIPHKIVEKNERFNNKPCWIKKYLDTHELIKLNSSAKLRWIKILDKHKSSIIVATIILSITVITMVITWLFNISHILYRTINACVQSIKHECDLTIALSVELQNT